MDSVREAFETHCPVPDGIIYDEELKAYQADPGSPLGEYLNRMRKGAAQLLNVRLHDWRTAWEKGRSQAAPAVVPEEPALFEVGKGEVVVNHGTHLGKSCVFIQNAVHPGSPGELCGDREPSDPDRLLPGERVIYCKDDEQAEQIANALCGRYSSAPAAVPQGYKLMRIPSVYSYTTDNGREWWTHTATQGAWSTADLARKDAEKGDYPVAPAAVPEVDRLADIVSRFLNTMWTANSKDGRKSLFLDAQKALRAYRDSAAAVPEEWKLVPVEPTSEMLTATTGITKAQAYANKDNAARWADCVDDWHNMLAAAPLPRPSPLRCRTTAHPKASSA